jgi:membrane peptidoglycan carboxypeptidase
MQLVKNLWLSKDKTASRKLEEALIVWMIENERLVSKERMLELYLNIIEWGPHIYGASQASHFYFNKDVDKLSLNEAIFMASIIPRPKKFHWYFDKERKLKPFLQDYYQLIGTKMLKRGVITERQLEKLEANVKISGHAIAYLHHAKDEDITLKTDTTSFNNLIKTDSLRIIDDLNLYFPNDENIQNQSN